MDVTLEQDGSISFLALMDISKGEELTWNYGMRPAKKNAVNPFVCLCDTVTCKKFYDF